MRMRMFLVALSALLVVGSAAFGQTDFIWLAGGTGNWDDPLMWDVGVGFPGALDTATLNNGTIDLNAADRAVGTLTFGLSSSAVKVSDVNRVALGDGRYDASYFLTFDQFTSRNNYTYGATVEAGLAGTGTIDVYDHNTTYNTGGLVATAVNNSFTGTMILHSPGAIVGSNGGWAQMWSLGAGATVVIEDGAMYQMTGHAYTAQTQDLNVQMHDGGVFKKQDGANTTWTLDGTVSLDGTGTFLNGVSNLDINAVISDDASLGAAAGRLRFTNTGTYGGVLRLNQTNTFTGGAEVEGPSTLSPGQITTIRAIAADSLGTSTSANVDALNGGRIVFGYDPTNAKLGTVSSHAGGVIELALASFSKDVTLDGGSLTVSVVSDYSGAVTLASTSQIGGTAGTMNVSGAITAAGGAKLIKSGTNSAYLQSANTLPAGVEVQQGTLYADALGSLGVGNVVANGGVIASNVTDAFDSATLITAGLNGVIDLMSTENNADLLIKAGGGFRTSNAAGQASVLNYTGTPVAGQTSVAVEAGAVLNANLPSQPLVADLLPGDLGFGVFKATSSGDLSVGLYSGSIYRGLALAAGNVTYSGTVTETPATPPDPDPTAGIGMYVGSAGNFTYQNATFNAVGANTIKFYGAGGHIISDANVFSGNLEQLGTGMLRVSAADAILNKTLTLHDGWLDIDNDNALNGATVGIQPGSSFGVDRPVATGVINVNGGGVYAAEANLSTATWNWNSGQFGTETYSYTTALPGPGMIDYLIRNGNPDARTDFASDVVLGNTTRLMPLPDQNGAAFGLRLGDDNPANPPTWSITTNGTQGTLAAQTGGSMIVNTRVDFAGKKLIIGDVDGNYDVMWRLGRNNSEVGTAGLVYLTNERTVAGQENVIGSIDVRSGTLRANVPRNLGDPTSVNVGAGTTLLLAHYNAMAYTDNWPLSGIYGGDGTIVAQDGTAGRYVRVTPDGIKTAALSPGTSAGTLNISGSLRFDTPVGASYGQLLTEVLGHGAGAHDLLAVTGNVVLDNGELVVSLPLPGAGLKPSTPNWATPDPDDVIVGSLGDMTILTGASVAGAFAVQTIAPTIGVDADPGTPGTQPDNHWMLATGASLTASSATDVVLKGADILWMGMPGDANLDDSCDVSDLSLLAGSYRKSGNWLQGDFNFDGNVDVSDLSLLAGNFRTSNPYFTPGSGGAPVPEPATLVLLGLGGLGLVARRRRK